MWSGPRNLSTAMMYSFGNREDFAVWDEPFYAAYLAATGLDHPMRGEVLASGETDPEKVAETCAKATPCGREHCYMKHMPHHMLPGFPVGWTSGCVNVHLLRHPARVIASYAAKREEVTLEDIGFRQQSQLFARIGGLVIDSADIRVDPRAMLGRLCAEIGLPFSEAMLSWPSGGHSADGVWAAHWYGAVHRSTGFAGPEGPLPALTGRDLNLAEAAMPYYREMEARKLSL